MSIDRAKVLQAAQKYLAKGQLDKAIAEYRRLMQDDPKDARTLLKIGDIYTRKGDNAGATAAYGQVAEHYADQGFFLKAVAVYKQILKLDPGHLASWEKLAEMYELLSLVNDALSTYDQLATVYTRANDSERALVALGKMVALDPENVPATIKYAEALSRAGRSEDAAQAFASGASRLKQQGRIDDYLKVSERLLFHRPNDAELARELAGLYLERRDAKHALAKLQVCFKVDPKDVPTLQLLAEAFHLLGQHAKTISVYEEVARLHADAGRDHQRRAILRRILELDPSHEEARAVVGAHRPDVPPEPQRVAAAAAATQIAVAETDDVFASEIPRANADFDPIEERIAKPGMAPTDDFDPHGDFASESSFDDFTTGEMSPTGGGIDEDPVFADEEPVFADDIVFADDDDDAPEPAAYPPLRPSQAAPASTPNQIALILKECDVFMRYGLYDKVMAQIERALTIDPEHVGARVRLKDALIATGNISDAVLQAILLADDIGERDPHLASELLTEAIRLDPNNDLARAQLQSLRMSIPPEELVADPDPFLVPEGGADDDDDDDAQTGRRSLSPQQLGESAVDGFEDFEAVDSDGAEEPAAVVMVEDEDPFADEPVLQASDATADSDDEDEPATGLFSVTTRPASTPPRAKSIPAPTSPRAIAAPTPVTPPTVATPEPAAEEELPADVSDALEEVDFYLAQGMTDEARDVINDALGNHPGMSALLRKLAEVNGEPFDEDVATGSGDADGDQSFALAEKLAQSPESDRAAGSGGGDAPVDVKDVIAQFRQGVSKHVDPNDAATHYDLGIAYMEMGLHDDAIAAFTLCLSSERHVCTAQTMIGLSNVAKGEWLASIGSFNAALAAPHSPTDELGLLFEIGNAYELLGKITEAQQHYAKVHAADPAYRDVASRLTRVTKQKPKDEGEEFDSLFDDLMLKE